MLEVVSILKWRILTPKKIRKDPSIVYHQRRVCTFSV